MRKIYALGAGAILWTAALAGEPSVTTLDDQMYYGGFFPECISANGQYVSGSTFAMAGFVSEWQKQNTKVYLEEDGSFFENYGCDLPFVTSKGVALGFDDRGAMKIDFPNGKITRLQLSNPSIGLAGLLPAQMTEDESIIVGLGYYTEKKYSDFGSEHTIDNQAAYWENGECKFLPVPTEEELGYYILGSRAWCISADGSVIMGCLTDRLATNPMVLWFRQPDGSYKLDAVCMRYFSDTKYNDGSYKEFVNFRGEAMSNDGSKIAMSVRKAPAYGSNPTGPFQMARYDTHTGEIELIEVNGENGIYPDDAFEFFWTGISNDGTMVGWLNNGVTSFILYPDDSQPRLLADVFNTLGELADFDDIGTNKVSSISPDGRYICGVGWTENAYMGWYDGYILDTGKETGGESAVKAIEMPQADGKPVYYNISGQRVENPENGIFIVRYPDGSSRKEIINK